MVPFLSSCRLLALSTAIALGELGLAEIVLATPRAIALDVSPEPPRSALLNSSDIAKTASLKSIDRKTPGLQTLVSDSASVERESNPKELPIQAEAQPTTQTHAQTNTQTNGTAPLVGEKPLSLLAQASPLPPGTTTPPSNTLPDVTRPEPALPEAPLPTLPPADELLPTPATPGVPGTEPTGTPAVINVTRYEVKGSTVFSAEEFAAVTKPFLGRISFAQLLQARSAITKLYVDRGYVTSGAFIPPQTLEGGLVEIQILEGRLEDINVTGLQRLQPGYVRSRLAKAAAQPLNVNQLLEGLRLLQLDPRLAGISADLQAGIEQGTSLLDVQASETDPFSATVSLDNGRSPSVGSVRGKLQLSHNNLVGWGDELDFSFSHTRGSNSMDVSYTVPINPSNGTVRLAYGRTSSEVIEEPFTVLDIQSRSKYYELSIRQPLQQTASEEFVVGATFSHQVSQTALGLENIGPFPLSPGADDNGETRVSALRLFQEWSQRSTNQVLAARSQFSIGRPWLGASDSNDDEIPDSSFWTWRGQAQWVRLLAPDMLMLMKTDLQLADRILLPLEQFGSGGQSSIRGYRQDALLTDNGFLFSTEVRLPVWRIPSIKGLLQVAPFVDVGRGWNSGNTQPNKQTLAGVGLGVLWRHGDNFSARLDWGYPLVDLGTDPNTWQERGIYFSINYTPF